MNSKDNLFNKEEYYLNRELSWLEFNDRVIKEAKDNKNPLFERLKFLAIAGSNLDEFFMVRVASLKDQVNAEYTKPDPAGLKPKEQLNQISQRVHRMVHEQYNALNRGLLPKLKKNNINIVNSKSLMEEQRQFLQEYFDSTVYPVLTPMAVDASRPFPLILNKSLNIGILMDQQVEEGELIFATVQVPAGLPRLIELPSSLEKGVELIFLEDVIKMNVSSLFSGYKIVCASAYRITRNADLSIEEEEAEDLLKEIERSLQKRKWGAAVRLEIEQSSHAALVKILRDSLEIHEKDIYHIKGPLDLTFLWKIYRRKGFEHLKYPEYIPTIPPVLVDEEDLFEVIRQQDLLLHHPYESFDPIVEFVEKASKDPNVLAIKQTLYRVSGDSPIIKALAEAAKRGKQVTVLVELKARFDEEVNIHWAKKLEQSGCHVIYGLVGLKTHCKMTLVVRKEAEGMVRYVHLGTGNYNDITAKLYTDVGLLTVNEEIGADVTALFNMLSGYSYPPELSKIAVAPLNLREKFLELIYREAKNAELGRDARIIAKMNSLVDKHIIQALYYASTKGVKIHLIVRGICCLRPAIPDVSENITVTSIVGRVLEHSRIYYFYNDAAEEVYISSADWMPRNLDRRVEVLVPIEDKGIRNRIVKMLTIEINDNVKTRVLNSQGIYHKIDKRGKQLIDTQRYFFSLASKQWQQQQRERKQLIFELKTMCGATTMDKVEEKEGGDSDGKEICHH
ncbi:RNA degradosome polyphosphate kinase [Alkaliphilus hydrothermalis]|uniref:Polyphosphate kinase n=1 Tax=Alkaliphilus hydrothermalis TaxID=1482730 RepID=A0ABS2NP29_9FIRM|nr:polyphosphate kinase [Alkaliphilus hydrothermalis]